MMRSGAQIIPPGSVSRRIVRHSHHGEPDHAGVSGVQRPAMGQPISSDAQQGISIIILTFVARRGASATISIVITS